MKRNRTLRPGFTLIELLVVITIIIVLTSIALPVYGRFRNAERYARAKNTMKALVMAVEKYKDDLGDFPPDTVTGSEMIYSYLCTRLNPTVTLPDGSTVASESHFGPYLQAQADQFQDASAGGTSKKFISPLGTEYSYVVIVDPDLQRRNFLLIDPGPDLDLGGSINNQTGFTSSGNASADNIFSATQKNAP
jgi:prepilin-type N-terminal cleavage/methylation domain-containing protein